MNVVLRKFDQTSDVGFIYDTWPKGLYHASATKITRPKKVWFEAFYNYVNNCMEDCLIRIACLQDEPYTIIGYAVIDLDTLLWIYVKEDYRRQGIANLLTATKVKKYNDQMTKLGKLIIDARKREPHGRNENEPKTSETH